MIEKVCTKLSVSTKSVQSKTRRKLLYEGRIKSGHMRYGPPGGTFIFSSYVGSGPASTLHPPKKSGISSQNNI